MNAHSFELVVLDIMLPGRCRIEILSAMRKQGLKIPVLIVTAKDAIEDRVQGLDAGAVIDHGVKVALLRVDSKALNNEYRVRSGISQTFSRDYRLRSPGWVLFFGTHPFS